MSWRWLAGWALTAALVTFCVGSLWAATPGFVPLLLFAWFWWARPLVRDDWDEGLRQLLKEGK